MMLSTSKRIWLLLAALLCAAMWTLVPVDTGEAVVGARQRDDWQLVNPPRWTLPATTAALVAAAPFWGKQERVGAESTPAAPLADPRWRLAGVVGPEQSRRVLVVFADPSKHQQFFKLGDRLPSGHKITRIDERLVCVEVGKRQYTLAIERTEIAP